MTLRNAGGNGTSVPHGLATANTLRPDRSRILAKPGAGLAKRVRAWLEEHRFILPPHDCPAFDMTMYNVARVDHVVAQGDYGMEIHQKLALAEFVWARNAVACGIEELNGFNIYEIATCNMQKRWTAPKASKQRSLPTRSDKLWLSKT